MSTYDDIDHEQVDNGPAYKVVIAIILVIMATGIWGTIWTVI